MTNVERVLRGLAPQVLGQVARRCRNFEDAEDAVQEALVAAAMHGRAIPLTLRACGGLTTAEIAAAFLVLEATMAQRISRAKQRIKASGVPFALPTDGAMQERLRSVLHVLYLIFSEGTPPAREQSSHAASCRRKRSG